jgi:hypothetical protein
MLTFLAFLFLAQIPTLPSQSGAVTGVVRTAAGKPAAGVRVGVSVTGGGKVPIFQNGRHPLIRATNVANKNIEEIFFSASTLVLPVPLSSTGDEYNVTVQNLEGYTIKSLTYASSDLKKETLKARGPVVNVQPVLISPNASPIAVQILQQALQSVGIQSALPGAPLTLILEKTPTALPTSGVRVIGRSVGLGDGIYLSGTPGVLYSDGTFEFHGVSPGLHRVVKPLGTLLTAGSVLVGNRDVDDLALAATALLPMDVNEPLNPGTDSNTASKALAMVSIAGQVIDETSREALTEGAVTITGYKNARRSHAIVGDRFRIGDLLPGAYSLTINVTGYLATTQTLTVGPEDLKLELIAQKETQ